MNKRIITLACIFWSLGLYGASLYAIDIHTDLIFHYSFDEFDTVVPDMSGNGHNGLVVGDVEYEPDGRTIGGVVTGAAHFLGTEAPSGDSYIDLNGPSFLPQDTPTSEITVATWVKTPYVEDTGCGNSHHSILCCSPTPGGYDVWSIQCEIRVSSETNARWRFVLANLEGTTVTDICDIKGQYAPMVANTWYHFAGTYNQDTGKVIVYLNGEFYADETMDNVEETIPPLAIAEGWIGGARIGSQLQESATNPDYYCRKFHGLMDEFYVFKRALSQEDVQALMDPPPVVATVDETNGKTIVFEANDPPYLPGTDTFTVVLNSQPTADVNVIVDPNTVNYDDYTLSGGVSPPDSQGRITLEFTTENWNDPQTVTVEAVDDEQAESSFEKGKIRFFLISEDEYYNNGYVPPVLVTIADDDSPGVYFDNGDGLVVSENGLTDTYQAILLQAPEPGETVTIMAHDAPDPNEVEIFPASLTFTAADLGPKTFTVVAKDDTDPEPPDLYYVTNINHSISCSNTDSGYEQLVTDPLKVTIIDNECGAWGYDPMDLNTDCRVNLQDFRLLAAAFLHCTTPYQPGCARLK